MSFNIDSKSVLVDALKLNLEDFELSNTILPKKSSLRAIYELHSLESDLLDFAKDPEKGLDLLPPPPRPPDLRQLNEDDAEKAKTEYEQIKNHYELERQAMSMHVPLEDYMMVKNYMLKFRKTITATSAIKGKRFHAFTKETMKEPEGILAALKGESG